MGAELGRDVGGGDEGGLLGSGEDVDEEWRKWRQDRQHCFYGWPLGKPDDRFVFYPLIVS